MFGRATIRLGIGPHSSFNVLSVDRCMKHTVRYDMIRYDMFIVCYFQFGVEVNSAVHGPYQL